jgi:hypothetical protein
MKKRLYKLSVLQKVVKAEENDISVIIGDNKRK